ALEDDTWSVTVLERIRYFKQISLYRDFFPNEQIRVVLLDQVRSNPEQLRSLYLFLGIEPLAASFPRANASLRKPLRPQKPLVPGADRIRFIDLVGDDTRKILEYAGLPADHWNLAARW